MRECVTGLQHIGLPVKDFDAACKFYSDLGFENIYETRQPNDGKVSFYRLGNLEMEIYEADDAVGQDGAIQHIALNCTDIDRAYKKAQDMKMPIISNGIENLPYWDKGIKFFHLRGPAGERVEFCQKL